MLFALSLHYKNRNDMEKSITVSPCAKINLGLNIVAKRADGYHDLETVFYPVDIRDTITITAMPDSQGECHLSIEGKEIEGNPENNLVVKAYRAVSERYNIPSVNIRLKKKIPMQAGMGGGSADCAFTITALNGLFCLGMTEAEMQAMAASLGADCAFFVSPTPAFATGIGERLTPIALDLSDYFILVVKPDVAVSTREAFSGISVRKPERCSRDIVMDMPVEKWRQCLVNDFEQSIFSLHPELEGIKKGLYALGARYAAMSGSGSSLFGIFEECPCDVEHAFGDMETYILRML